MHNGNESVGGRGEGGLDVANPWEGMGEVAVTTQEVDEVGRELEEATRYARETGDVKMLRKVMERQEGLGIRQQPQLEVAEKKIAEYAPTKEESEKLFSKEFEGVFQNAYKTYEDVLEAMGKRTEILDEETARAEAIVQYAELKKAGMIDYCLEDVGKHGKRGKAWRNKYNFVIVPNIDVTRNDIFDAAIYFGEHMSKKNALILDTTPGGPKI